ncbi:hypothetical protein [Gorillibacterium timonense]|uniref:hypothetical protein n=1 Tax=Gorillibacterium timonense TaxID=1689269 RepID=UPI00071C4B6A|nr:hypothetical protein [Gorillibacterium timonense]
MTRNQKGVWTVINLLIGAPGGFVFIFTVIGLDGFMGPPTRRGQTAAVAMAVIYLLIWLLANVFMLKDVKGRQKLLWFGASLLLLVVSAFLVTLAIVQSRVLS